MRRPGELLRALAAAVRARPEIGLGVLVSSVVTLAVVLNVTLRFGGLYLASDDSYIYLGYVKRALEAPRALFSYNEGEHSAGTTGLLYYYLLVVVAQLTRLVSWGAPLHATLRAASYLTNAALVACAATLYFRAWRRLDGGFATRPVLTTAVAGALFFASSRCTWGLYAGMENPLSAALVLALFVAFVEGASLARVGAIAALLSASRPELAPLLAFAVPARALFAVRARELGARAAARSTVLAIALFGALLAALVLPCLALTGRLFPSALDTRIRVEGMRDLAVLARGLVAALRPELLWKSRWHAAATCAAALALLGLATKRRTGPMLAAALAVHLVLLERAAFRIEDFNIEDRYVSYFACLLALSGGTALFALAPRLARSRGRELPVAALVVAAAALGPVREGIGALVRDVREMNQIVVTPARYMEASLPRGSRIAMEPAGALRVFSSHYLVDALGLTTAHRAMAPSYDAMLERERVTHVFDYPGRLPQLADGARFELVATWAPDPQVHTWPIGLYRVRTSGDAVR